MLSTSSFNALLKTLEEPPSRVVFIMATTELHKVPDTILSRCQQFEFRTIALNKIVERLRLIADAEKISVSIEALREIARAGMGSMRDAQSAFDQVISFSGEKIETNDVTSALGIAGTDLLVRVIEAISKQQPATALRVVDELVSRGQDLRNFCRDLLAHLRDLLVVKVAGETNGLLDSAVMSEEELSGQAAPFSESDLTRFFHSLAETETKLRDALQPRYVLEVGLVKLIEMRRMASLEKVLERLAKLEAALLNSDLQSSNLPADQSSNENKSNNLKATNKPVAQAPAAPDSFASIEQAHTVSNFVVPIRTSTETLETVEKKTTAETAIEIVQTPITPVEKIEVKDGDDVRFVLQAEIEKRNLMWLSISLEKASAVKISNNQLMLEFALNNKQYYAAWEAAENVKILTEICQELFNRQLKINVELTGKPQTLQLSDEDKQKQREKDDLWQIAEKDLNVQAVLKTFRGRIIDVWQEDSNNS
jgi:DNA polymerase-3 subunit gamma/tau